MATATVVRYLPAKIWVESGVMGERVVVVQHEGCEAFDYAVFNYDYRYTSNSGTWEAAHRLAVALGAAEPVETRQRSFEFLMPTAEQLREQIAGLQEMLKRVEAPKAA